MRILHWLAGTYMGRRWISATKFTYRFFGGWRFFVLPPFLFILGLAAHHWGVIRFPFLGRIAGEPVNELAVYSFYGVAAVVLAVMSVWVAGLISAAYREDRKQRAQRQQSQSLRLECDDSDIKWKSNKRVLDVFIRVVNTSQRKTIDDVTIVLRAGQSHQIGVIGDLREA